MERGIKILLVGVGLMIWAILIERVGFWEVMDQLGKVGWDGIMIILIPYCLILYFDTRSWRIILEGVMGGRKVSQTKLVQVKLIGDTMNNLIPAGGVFGDMIKWSLLKKNGASWVEGVSSIYVARITMAQGELLYVGVGVMSFFLILEKELEKEVMIGFMIGVGLIMGFVFFVDYMARKKGLVKILMLGLEILGLSIEKWKFRLRAKLKLEEKDFLEFDEKIFRLYGSGEGRIWRALWYHFLGWVLESVELYLVVYFCNVPINGFEAIAIGSFSAIFKSMIFFIPGGFGVLEGSVVILLGWVMGMEEGGGVGLAYGVIRRFRELLWVGVGFLLMMRLKVKWTDWKGRRIGE